MGDRLSRSVDDFRVVLAPLFRSFRQFRQLMRDLRSRTVSAILNRRSPLAFVLALAKGRLAQRPSMGAGEWKPISTVATTSATIPELYYPPEELARQRENTRRATEHAAAYIAVQLEKAKRRRERRGTRP